MWFKPKKGLLSQLWVKVCSMERSKLPWQLRIKMTVQTFMSVPFSCSLRVRLQIGLPRLTWRGGEMPVNTLYASFFQRFSQTVTPAGFSATAHRGGHRHQATQTNPQPPTGDARYGLSSLIFFLTLSLDSFAFTCISSLSWHSPACSTLLFSSPVLPHCPNIYSHSSHYPLSYTCTSSALSSILPHYLSTIPSHSFFSTNPINALPINEEPIPLSVQTYFSFHGHRLTMVLNTETSLRFVWPSIKLCSISIF